MNCGFCSCLVAYWENVSYSQEKSCGWVVVVVQQEFANRLMVLSADNLQQLVACLHTHSLARNNSLQVLLYPFI